MPDRRAFLTQLAAGLRPKSAKRPNVLFLVGDQWRGQALSSAGDPNLVAPNLARLAQEGVDFQRAYTSYPVCCPSRAAMLTGKFPHAAGVPRNHTLLPLSEQTMSAQMQRAGYRTGYIGKWHLDGGEGSGFVPLYRRRGFEYWAAHNLSHRHYGSVYFRDTDTPIPVSGFEPDHQTDLAVDFMRRKDTNPFFLYLSWVAPHPPLTPPGKHAIYDPRKIQLRPNVPERAEAEARKNSAGYYGLCSAVDENLGRLLTELDLLAIAADTIVVFTADHGYTLGSHGLDEIDQPYEEAIRIPLLIRYPKRIKMQGKSDALISNVDYAPTLLSLCGVEKPSGMQGMDLSRWLTELRGPRRTSIYAQGSLDSSAEWRMIRKGDDKLVVDRTVTPTHLYRLDADPFELRNLVADPGERRRRESLLTLLRQSMARTSDRVLYQTRRSGTSDATRVPGL